MRRAGDDGALGIGNNMPAVVSQPISVSQPPAFYSEIDTGSVHTCGIANDGRVFCWGDNGSGQLGNGTQADASVPTVVSLEYIVPSKIGRLLWP